VSETWTTLRVLEWTTDRFARAGFDSARLEAQVLLAHVLRCTRIALYTLFDRPLSAAELAAARELIRRRLDGEPTAYLVGEQEFWSLPIKVDPRVLIPRRDSETLIEVVLEQAPDRSHPRTIADIATGSGALAIALAHELPGARVVATDLSAGALALAADNARRNQVADRIELREGDLLAALRPGERFDVLLSNPPYVRSADIDLLAAEVRREPRAALDGGADGLDCIRRLVASAAEHLSGGGLLAIEHGHDQGHAVIGLIEATGGFRGASTRQDLARRPRVSFAIRR
jgi:release factor glutamine methyltransferase